MYEEHVLKHFDKPFNKGLHPQWGLGIYISETVSEICGDRISMAAYIEDGVIIDLWWLGDGCCFSQAAASMLVEHMNGKLVADIDSFTDKDMFNLFQAECPDIRRGCVLVALEALRKISEQIT